MANTDKKKENNGRFTTVIIVVLCIAMLVLSVWDIRYAEDEARNLWIGRILQQTCGCLAVILLLARLKIKAFGKPQNWLYLIPCLVIAVNNFPFWSYFNGNMRLVKSEAFDFLLFAMYCLSVGLFEELVFRGVLFSLLAERFSKDKKGLVITFFVSSLVFALAHLFNLFMGAGVGATLLQVCYTALTGGLFAFVFIKSKNILCCAFVHALYNFCGLIMEIPSRGGMGSGVVFDLGTGLTMGGIAVIMGLFVLYSLWKVQESERICLYERLGIPND